MSKHKKKPIVCFACGYDYRTALGRKRMMIGMKLGSEKQVFCLRCAKGVR